LLAEHTQGVCQHLESEDDNEFKCERCLKSFYTDEAKNDHLAFVHKNRKCHLCATCGAEFGYKFLLEKHNCLGETVEANPDEEETGLGYSCKKCEKSFENKQSLVDHLNYFHEKRKCHQVSFL
jgi:DNA-directed RNA polymerase subunit RPC12/RpoP